jgi:hypothetical protein
VMAAVLTLHQGAAETDLGACTERAADALDELAARVPAGDVLKEPMAALAACLAARKHFQNAGRSAEGGDD